MSRPKGLLRVSAPSALGRLHLVPILPEYLTRHPDVAIDLVLSDRLVDLVEERFDIAIQSSPLTPARISPRSVGWFAPRRATCRRLRRRASRMICASGAFGRQT